MRLISKRQMMLALSLLLILSLTQMVMGQERKPLTGIVNEKIGLFDGPGNTYKPVATLDIGAAVNVRGRTEAGNWLYVTLDRAQPLEGWILTGYVTLPDETAFSRVPVIRAHSDANIDNVFDPLLKELYAVPILPEIDEQVCALYQGAVEAGREPFVISKVGDSNSAAAGYLTPIGQGKVELGPYDYLQNAVDVFGPSMAIESAATRVGMSSSAIFDPMWSNRSVCEAGETPLACEYRRTNPAVAVIMFGANDVRILNSEGYETQLRRVIEETLAADILPLVVSFSTNPQIDNYYQTLVFNQITLHLAQEYEVPYINFWSAGRILINGGVGPDNVHLTDPGASFRLGSNESRFGMTLHNLMVLNTLDQLLHACGDVMSTATPEATQEGEQ